jgi:hypothetical protein
MFLENLTEEDVKILDEIWAIETTEELDQHLKTLDAQTLRRTLTLIDLLQLASIDDDVNAMESYPEAENMLKSIMS